MNEQKENLQNIVSDLADQETALDEFILKATVERNFYLQKLRQIEKIGEAKDWQDPSGLLEQLS